MGATGLVLPAPSSLSEGAAAASADERLLLAVARALCAPEALLQQGKERCQVSVGECARVCV